MKDHSHCWEQKQPPACGLQSNHERCCLCEERNVPATNYWRERIKIDIEDLLDNFVRQSPIDLSWTKIIDISEVVSHSLCIERLRTDAKREALQSVLDEYRLGCKSYLEPYRSLEDIVKSKLV